jgi:hypothetical protein
MKVYLRCLKKYALFCSGHFSVVNTREFSYLSKIYTSLQIIMPVTWVSGMRRVWMFFQEVSYVVVLAMDAM